MLLYNYVHPGLEIKMTKDKGRGIFCTKDFKKHDLLVVEKPLAFHHIYLNDEDRKRAII